MNEQEREAILREIAKKKAVLTLPGMESVDVRRDIAWRGDLLMDVYVAAAGATRPPLVVIVMGFQDPTSNGRAYGPMTSWARLLAATGVAAAIYGAAEPAEDLLRVLAFVRTNAETLGVDADRIGLLAMSGNGPTALSALMRDRQLKTAALLSGYTMDLDGATAVKDDARQYAFADACAGKSVDDLPDGVPMLFLRTGRERFPSLNEALDKVIAKALARNLPITLVNHATGAHGFDLDEDNEVSREMIRQVLAFLAFHLGGVG